MLNRQSINILGHIYTINYSSAVKDSAHIYIDKLEIHISKEIRESRQEEGLFHEILEALNYHLGLELEHKQTVAISEGLYSVLKLNNLLTKE